MSGRRARREAQAAPGRHLGRLAAGEANLRRLLNAIADGILIVDRHGVVRYANPAAEALFGRPRDELVGVEFGYPISAGRTTEVDVVRAAGSAAVVEMRVVESEWDGEPALIASLRDITERKQAEAERARRIREQIARAEAEAALRARDEFLSVTAHELKTPVTRLRVAIQQALRRLERRGELTPEAVAETLRTVDLETEHLARLVVQLLDLSRIQDGTFRLNRSRVDLRSLVEKAAKSVRSAGPRPGIELRLPPDPVPAWVDPEQYQHVVMSLLDNAVRFSLGSAAPIEVDLGIVPGAAESQGPSARLTVRDHGVGIPEEHRAHIFDRFHPAHTQDHVSGLGVGLYVCRQIVELHGGRIEPSFPPDGGAAFTVTIPTGLDPIDPPPAPSQPLHHTTG